jgi:adenylate kinase
LEFGELVSDDLIVGLITEQIEQADAKRGFILDGFPRTIAQARALDELLARETLELDAVLELRVDEKFLLGRVTTRSLQAQAQGVTARKDDNPKVFRTRLEAYHVQTAPLIDYYHSKGMLRSIDGLNPIDTVANDIAAAIGA